MTRHKNIMTDILNSSPGESTDGVAALNKLIHDFSTTGNQPTIEKQVLPRRKKRGRGKKKKTTHYLTEQIFHNLGAVKEKIREMLPKHKKTTVSKSRIVNTALQYILDEFDKSGDNSLLFEFIQKQNQVKNEK